MKVQERIFVGGSKDGDRMMVTKDRTCLSFVTAPIAGVINSHDVPGTREKEDYVLVYLDGELDGIFVHCDSYVMTDGSHDDTWLTSKLVAGYNPKP